jgi:uncharacterized membrane protein YccC
VADKDARLFNEALRFDPSRFTVVGPLRVAIVAMVLVSACIVSGHSAEAVPITLGAVFVGLTDIGEVPGQRWRTMLWATASLTVATELGGAFSEHTVWSFGMTLIVASLCGFAGAISARAGLIGVVTLVAFCAFAGAPVGMRMDEVNTGLIALGGLIITAVTVVPTLLRRPKDHAAAAPDATHGPIDLWQRVRERAVPSNRYFWHAVRLPVGIGLATLIAWNIPVMHSYWIPVTVAWVTLPDSHLTNVKLVARIAGTIVGALATAILLLPWMHQPAVAALVVGVGVFLMASFLFAFYAIAVAGITMVILGLFSLVGDSVGENIIVRIAATIVAAGIVALVTFTWSKAEQRRHVHSTPWHKPRTL